MGLDPVGEGRVDLARERGHHPAHHPAIGRQVIAGQDGEGGQVAIMACFQTGNNKPDG